MDLFWNSDLVENITKAGKRMTVQDNGGTLAITHRLKMTGYKQDVWFRKGVIPNIIFLKSLLKNIK